MSDAVMGHDRMYVIATMSNDGQTRVPMFLFHQPTGVNSRWQTLYAYALTDDIRRALKATSRSIAEDLLSDYQSKGVDSREFAILPVDITYEIADE